MTPFTSNVPAYSMHCLSWPEASAEDITSLIGPENVSTLANGCVQVRNSGGEWCTLNRDWVVGVRDDNGMRAIFSASAYAVITGS